MGIPKIIALIGENAHNGNNNEFSAMIKDVKKVKKEEEPYIVFLVFDLVKEQIYFRLDKKLNQDAVYDYFYFGNNSAAASQYYLTREDRSIKYLLSSTFSDLYQMLNKYDMEDGELGDIIRKMGDKDIVSLADRKGGGRLNLNKFSIIGNGEFKKIQLDEGNNIVIDDKRYSTDDFIRLFIDDENKHDKFVLIVPKVKLDNGEEIILSTHKEYLKLVKKANKLDSSSQGKSSGQKVCYICKQKKDDVSSDYSKKFGRTGINKIFTTTTINTSPYLQQFNYDNAYSICGRCYRNLLLGEKVISEKFKSKIAGEDVFIIPEGVLGNFNYNHLNILKNDVDLAFKSVDAKAWIDTIESEKYDNNIQNYSINFLFYRTDGNSVTILETIEEVPTIRFERVMNVLAKYVRELKPHTYKMSLGSIYSLIPVKVNKNGEQLDIGRVLSLYKAILSGERISNSIFYNYALEALEKGLKQLGKSKIDNYYNMSLTQYVNGYDDFFIKKIVFGYITLIKVCQELELLDNEVFKSTKREDEILDIINTPSDKVNTSIMAIEDFLVKQGFDNDQKALFYLGVLINRVALAQIEKEHKKKPILRKIQFQGMNGKEICRLYQDTVEKLRQYNKMTLFTEGVMGRFHLYYGSAQRSLSLSDQASVFYIMAGYSYMVGNKSPDTTKAEEEAQIELLEDPENIG